MSISIHEAKIDYRYVKSRTKDELWFLIELLMKQRDAYRQSAFDLYAHLYMVQGACQHMLEWANNPGAYNDYHSTTDESMRAWFSDVTHNMRVFVANEREKLQEKE